MSMQAMSGFQSNVSAPARTPRGRTWASAALALCGLLPVASGCTSTQTVGQSSSYLIVDSLLGASGAAPSKFGGTLASDVLTLVKTTINGQEVRVGTVYEDVGQVTFRLALKDPGPTASPNQPSSTNFITVNRYHVRYTRADGRNTPGVDVPYPFDGGMTTTVNGAGSTATLSLVRIQAKEESPLRSLVSNGGAQVISTIAEITFYGTDQAGRVVSVVGHISVNFADWGDPE